MKDMNEKEILRHVDHTLLSQEAVWDEIRQVCDDAVKYDTASVCIPPSYVKQAAEYVGGRVPICTVIGFPNGYETTAVKEFETKDAIANGADEIDMVINIGWLKDRKYDQIEEEIRILKNACGSKVLKVIIETCLLTDEEKVKMCEIVTRSGADYIKTSTGFSKAGATFDDISLFADHVGGNVKMKAAGGISSMEDAEKFLELGADRLGTSRIVKIVKTEEENPAEGTCEMELSQGMIAKLIETATAQLAYSYSPYSGFKVGAALLAESGRIYTLFKEGEIFSAGVARGRQKSFEKALEQLMNYLDAHGGTRTTTASRWATATMPTKASVCGCRPAPPCAPSTPAHSVR